jgi:TfoX/Sxy family transcriptional regulator of competence genes
LQHALGGTAEVKPAFDESLAQRIRDALAAERGVSEKRMFGGVAFLLNRNMAIGVAGGSFMVRVGPEKCETLVAEPNAREMNFTGKTMKDFVYVGSAGLASDRT